MGFREIWVKDEFWTDISYCALDEVFIQIQVRWQTHYIWDLTNYHIQNEYTFQPPGLGSIQQEWINFVRFLIISCDQAALWTVFSVRPSVCLSVCLSHLFDYVPVIVSSWNFQELFPMTKVTSMQKVKVTEVTTQFNRFRTVTPVWIHIWWWNHAYGLMILRKGAILFLKVIRQISRSHDSKKRRVWPRLGVSGL